MAEFPDFVAFLRHTGRLPAIRARSGDDERRRRDGWGQL
jgi:hypothetical protein